MAVLGTIVAYFLGAKDFLLTQTLLGLAAGSFIYIAGSDLVPEIHRTGRQDTWKQLIAFFTGLGLMAALLLLE